LWHTAPGKGNAPLPVDGDNIAHVVARTGALIADCSR
jgi:hypothetical protein